MSTEHPIAAGRCADRLGQRLGRDDVHPADIAALAEAGHIEVVDVFTKKGRIVLAYNADFDRSVIVADCARHGIRRTRLADPAHWADVMVPRSDHAHSRRWLPNECGHRALSDVQQTRQHLLRMTAPTTRR
jgi:DNA polymerase III epsilon subunit-like protein